MKLPGPQPHRFLWSIFWAVLLVALILPHRVLAATSPWTQTDWSGGAGQTSWSDATKYSAGSSVTTTVANQVTLTANSSGWYNSAWGYRKKITLDTSTLNETLLNFPILVKLTTSNFTFSKTQSAGQDIRFTDSDGTTLLKYEIEKWDATNSQAVVWVKVPEIDANPATKYIYMYYGDSTATNAQDHTNVWGDVSRYHLSETSTTEANQFKASGYLDTGKLGQAVSMYGNAAGTAGSTLTFNRGLQISGNNYEHINTNQGTISFWFKPSWDRTDGKYHSLFSDGTGSQKFAIFKDGSNNFGARIPSVSEVSIVGQPAITSGNWYHVLLVWSKNTTDSTNYGVLYLNNSVVSQTTTAITPQNPVSSYQIGSHPTLGTANALIDDFAIYDRVLTTAEITSLYNSGTGNEAGYVADSSLKFYAKLDGSGTLQPVTYNGGASASKMTVNSTELTGGTNLVKNGNFESATSGMPTNWVTRGSGNVNAADAEAANILFDARSQKISPDASWTGLQQNITFQANTTYTLSFWYKNANSNLEVVVSDGSSQVFSADPTSATWVRYETTFKTTASAGSGNLQFRSGNPAPTLVAYIDNITITPNLVDNGGMEGQYTATGTALYSATTAQVQSGAGPYVYTETGKFATGLAGLIATDGTNFGYITASDANSVTVDFTGGSGTIATGTAFDVKIAVASGWSALNSPDSLLRGSTVHSGSYSQKVVASAASRGLITPGVVVPSGGQYLVSTWIYGVSGQVQFLTSGSTVDASITATPPATWTKYSFVVKTTADRYLIVRSVNGAATFYVDDISVIPLDNTALSFKAWTPVTDATTQANNLSVQGGSSGVQANSSGQMAGAYTFDGSTGYLRQTTSATNIGTPSYSGNTLTDDGQTFTSYKTSSGNAAYMLVVTNSDNTTSWGYIGNNSEAANTVTVYTTIARSTAGWNGTSPTGKTPVGYEVRKTNFQITGNLTVGAWFKTTNKGELILKYGDSAPSLGFNLDVEPDGRVRFWTGHSSGTSTNGFAYSQSVDYRDGNWHQAVGVEDNTNRTRTVYVDGVAGTVQTGMDGGSDTGFVPYPISIGDYKNASGLGLNGSIDEPFITSTALTAGWIATTYKSEADTLNTYGTEEQYYPASGMLTSSIFDTGQRSSFGNISYTATLPAGTAVAVRVRSSNASDMTGATDFTSCTALTFSGTPATASLASSNCVTDTQQYLQYQLTLSTTSPTATPTFQTISSAFTISTPLAPSGLSGTAASTTSMTWSWTDNSSDEAGFYVQTTGGVTKCTVSTSNVTTCTETDLAPNTSYIRQVVAWNSSGNSSASSSTAAVTLSTAPTTSNITANRATATWYNTPTFTFTNGISGGFGGQVQYFRYAWDTAATHAWTGSETQWTTGTLTTTATSDSASWYLHLKGYNSADVANGTLDFGPFYFASTAPTGTVSINSGAAYTNTTAVTLALTESDSGSGIAQMMVSQDSGFSGAAWQTYSSSLAFTLSSGDGTQTVYAKLKDNAGNISSAFSGSIVLDTTAPTSPRLTSPEDGSYTNNSRPTYMWTVSTDSGSGIAYYRLDIDNGGTGNFSINNISASYTTDLDTDTYHVHQDGTTLEVYTKHSPFWNPGANDGMLVEGKRKWTITAFDNAGNSAASSRTIYADYGNPALSNVALATDEILGTQDNYAVVTQTRPTITGTVTDTYLPDKLEVSVYAQNFLLGIETTRTLADRETVSLDNTSQNDVSFTFTPAQTWDYGKLLVEVVGIDKAGNRSAEVDLNVWLLSDAAARQVLTKNATPENKQAITEKIGQQSPLSIPALEKQALLRREKEAGELDKLLTTLGDQFKEVSRFTQTGIKHLMAGLGQALAQGWGWGRGNVLALDRFLLAWLRNWTGAMLAFLDQMFTSADHALATASNWLIGRVPVAERSVLLAVGRTIGRVTAAISHANHALALMWTHSQHQARSALLATQHQTGYLVTGLTRQLGGWLHGTMTSAAQTLGAINHAWATSQTKVSRVIAQNHAAATATMHKIGRGASLAFLSLQKPVNDTSDFLYRTKVWLLTFESIVIDPHPTTISQVTIEQVGRDYAVVSWRTNHYALGKVNYGNSLSYGHEVILSKMEQYHQAKLTGLAPGQRYFFEVMSQNKNYVYDAYYSFETTQ